MRKCYVFFFLFLRFYLFMRDTQREAETRAEGEAGSMQGPDAGLHPGTPRDAEPDAGLHPRTQDHDLSQRQTLNS